MGLSFKEASWGHRLGRIELVGWLVGGLCGGWLGAWLGPRWGLVGGFSSLLMTNRSFVSQAFWCVRWALVGPSLALVGRCWGLLGAHCELVGCFSASTDLRIKVPTAYQLLYRGLLVS